MRCPETLLLSLVWASRWQRLKDTAHLSPQPMPRNMAKEYEAAHTTTEYIDSIGW
jgi:hypothetical protein